MSEPKEVRYKNWLKAGLGLLYCKEGIQEFVFNVVNNFHSQTYANIGRYCNNCTTQNALTCPTQGICGRRCQFHDITDPTKKSINCPRQVCQRVRDEIINKHRYQKPSFKNTKAENWSSNPWELAKCYMAPTGYFDIQTMDSTDFTGLVSVIINYEPFQLEVNENLATPGNVFEKAREARNSIMHNAKMEISTSDLPTHLQTVKSVLCDAKIQLIPAAKDALKRILDLENDLISITVEDEVKIKEECKKAIKDMGAICVEEIRQTTTDSMVSLGRKIDEGTKGLQLTVKSGLETVDDSREKTLLEISDKTENSLQEINEKIRDGTHSLDRQFKYQEEVIQATLKSSLDTINESRLQSLSDLHEKKDKSVIEIERKTADCIGMLNSEKGEHMLDLQATIYSSKEELNQSTQRGLSEIREITEKCKSKIKIGEDDLEERNYRIQNTRTNLIERGNVVQNRADTNEDYNELKINLQTEIIEHYISVGLLSSPVPILFNDERIDVDELFVMPELVVKCIKRGHSGYTTMDGSIGSILRQDGQTIRRACVIGEAGYGKTFLCKKIVSSWCRIHSDKQPEKLTDSDISFLKSFDLLFYISLRNSKKTDVTAMIEEQIVREGLHSNLHKILRKESEKCLIVLDGLDEYSSTIGMPTNDTREKYSIILTSRPWKIELLRPSKHDLGQEVVLKPMSNNDMTIKAVVETLNDRYGEQNDWSKFKYSIWTGNKTTSKIRDEYERVTHLAEIPVMLYQMICLWYDGEDIGNKRSNMYREMLVHVFKVAEKHRSEQMCHLVNEQTTAMECLNKEFFFNFQEILGNDKYTEIIYKLANLSYHTIFSSKKEEALIFSHSDMSFYELSREEVQISLVVGLLSQEKISRKVTKQEKSLSFIHKTYQEFLAAVYIAGDENIFREMLNSLKSLDLVMEMSQVLVFVVGLNSSLLSKVSMHIAELADTDQRLLDYRNSIQMTKDTTMIEMIHCLILACIDECWNGVSSCKQFVDLLDVYRESTHRNAFLNTSQQRFQALIQCLNVRNIRSVCDISYESLLVFQSMDHLHKIQLRLNTQEQIDLVSKIVSNCDSTLTCFTLRHYEYISSIVRMRAEVKNLFYALSKVDNLTGIFLHLFEFSHEDISYMGGTFSYLKHLQEVSIGYIKCYSCKSDMCEYSLDLRHNSKLKILGLVALDGDIQLNENVKVEQVEIYKMKSENRLLESLKNSVSLKDLDITPMDKMHVSLHEAYLLSTSKVILEILPTLHNLERIMLTDIDFEDEDLIVSCLTKEMEIRLNRVTMTLKCLESFVECILQSSHKIFVVMSSYIKPKQDVHLAEQYILDRCFSPYEHTKDDHKIDMIFTNRKNSKTSKHLNHCLNTPSF